MTTKRFSNYPELTSALAFDLIDAIEAADWGAREITAEYGASGQSCSRYVEISVYNEDDDFNDDFKIRFSDHGDRHGSDVTLRIDDKIQTIEDEGAYIATEIDAADYAALITEAMQAAREAISEMIDA